LTTSFTGAVEGDGPAVEFSFVMLRRAIRADPVGFFKDEEEPVFEIRFSEPDDGLREGFGVWEFGSLLVMLDRVFLSE
jgi:hypothetical protein